MGDPDGAAQSHVELARSCADVGAALDAAWWLKQAGQCDRAVSLLAEFWSQATPQTELPLLDGIARCVSAVSLPDALAFLSPSQRGSYLALRDRRAARNRCGRHCSDVWASCIGGCYDRWCEDWCRGTESACLARCP
jgi:hypothetical protein